MKAILFLLAALALAGCGNALTQTAPGAELPARGFDICTGHDSLGRCTEWASGRGEIRARD